MQVDQLSLKNFESQLFYCVNFREASVKSHNLVTVFPGLFNKKKKKNMSDKIFIMQ